jgi:hypothetical protein
LIVGGKGVLVEQYQFRVVGAHLREVRELPFDRSNQIRLTLHALVVGHRAKRIADSESARIPLMSGGIEEKVKL